MSKSNREFFNQKKEWSVIKDRLLGCYLPQYFQKLLMTGKPIYYVDCFAGKGKFDDGELGSPLIAMQIRNKRLSASKASQAKLFGAIKLCFIELNYAEDLSRNIADVSCLYDRPEVISGKFENNIREKLQDKRGQNVFLYIDPYGIQSLNFALFDELQTYGFNSLEMLINFNSFGFFRNACRVMKVDYTNDSALSDLEDLVEYDPTEVDMSSSLGIKKSEQMLNSIAGGDYWKDIVRGFHNKDYDGYSAEKRLSTEYREHLKKRHNYVLDMPIRIKAGQRPKYRMIHVSNHKDACFLMAKNMQSRKDELFIDIQNKGQLSLLDAMSNLSSTIEGEILTEDDIVVIVKKHIVSCQQSTGIRTFLAEFCNKFGLICTFDMIYKILCELEIKGDIEIVRNPAFTKIGKKSKFWDETDGKTVIIRRKLL